MSFSDAHPTGERRYCVEVTIAWPIGEPLDERDLIQEAIAVLEDRAARPPLGMMLEDLGEGVIHLAEIDEEDGGGGDPVRIYREASRMDTDAPAEDAQLQEQAASQEPEQSPDFATNPIFDALVAELGQAPYESQLDEATEPEAQDPDDSEAEEATGEEE